MFEKYNKKPLITTRTKLVLAFGGLAIFLCCGFIADVLIQDMSPDPIAVADVSGSGTS